MGSKNDLAVSYYMHANLAVRDECRAIAAWLRKNGKPQIADAIKAGEHLE